MPGAYVMTEEEARAIPGWFSANEADAIALASGAQRGLMVEIGTWCGKSTALVALRLPGWQIVTIDSYPPAVVVEHGADLGAHPADLAAADLAGFPNVSRVRVDSITAVASWPRSAHPDLLFVDGNHEEEHVLAELKAWVPRMAPRCAVLMHDGSFPGVSRAAERFFGMLASEDRMRVLIYPPAPWRWLDLPNRGSIWAFGRG